MPYTPAETWAQQAVKAMLSRVLQGIAQEYLRRAKELRP